MLSGQNLTTTLLLVVALVVSVVLHEMMHGVVAFWLGDRTAADAGRLTLNPLASIDPIGTILLPLILIITVGLPFFAAKPVPFNPDRVKWDEYGAALVGLAGPATNFVLALVAALLFRATGGVVLLHELAYYLTLVNVGMMVFNLIPIPPLDGSRVLYAFAPEPVQRVMEQIESMGFISILVIMFLFLEFLSGPLIHIEQSLINALL